MYYLNLIPGFCYTYSSLLRSKYLLVMMMCLAWNVLPAQNVAINSDGSPPDRNAMLDIKSSNKGLLIPRMSTQARVRIPNTAGLMVYDTNTNSFWYNTGKRWQNMSASFMSVADSAWLLTGNSGTVDNTHFLGTLDNVALNIRVNNQPSGRIDHVKKNTFWGYTSGFSITTGTDNTGIGFGALSSNTTGFYNTAIGTEALYSNTTGYLNTAAGFSSMKSSTGVENAAYGAFTLYASTTGSRNAAVGTNVLASNTSGSDNTAIGQSSLNKNSSGNYNTAAGSSAMFSNTTGTFNTGIGTAALYQNSTGLQNTAVGLAALSSNTTGSYNTAIGNYADVSANNLTNATAIGYNTIVNASNKVRIGNAAVTVIEGQVPFTTPSDGRFKFNINEDVKGLDFILQLRPVTYQFDVKRFDANSQAMNEPSLAAMQAAYDEASLIRRSGFIAQEVEHAALQTGYNFSGVIRPKTAKDHYSLSYDAFVVPLVKAVQEQQEVILLLRNKLAAKEEADEARDKKLAELQGELAELRKVIRRLK